MNDIFDSILAFLYSGLSLLGLFLLVFFVPMIIYRVIEYHLNSDFDEIVGTTYPILKYAVFIFWWGGLYGVFKNLWQI